MPRWLRWMAGISAFVLLGLYAYEPLLSGGSQPGAAAGWVDSDFRALAELREVFFERDGEPLDPDAPFRLQATQGHPLAALSLALSAWFWSDGGSWVGRSALALRLENLAWLWLAAFGCVGFLRRLIWPWAGSYQAYAASVTAALFFCVHPLNLGAVASVVARGELLALALVALAGSCFLRGRQERQHGFLVLAGLLSALAGFASDLVWVVPFLFAFAELFSARRHRRLPLRLRTAATTFVIFGTCAALFILVASGRSGALRFPTPLARLASLQSVEDWGRALAFGVEKFGLLVLPVNSSGLGMLGFVLAGALFLAALQPGFSAARSAPRLWGWFLLTWVSLLLLAELPGLGVRVHTGDFTRARVLLPAAAAMSMGLAVSSTAVSGVRRTLLPLAIAFGFAILAHGNARSFAAAGREAERLQVELAGAVGEHGSDARLLVLDPPGLVRGVQPVGESLPWILDPAFVAQPLDAGGWVRGIGAEGLRILVRQPEFDELRQGALVLVFDAAQVAPGEPAPGADEPPQARLGAHEGARYAVRLPAPAPSAVRRSWWDAGGSPELDLEALSVRWAQARVALDTDTSRPPRLGWRARGAPGSQAGLAREGSLEGVWIEGDDEPLAAFDLNRSLAWLLGDRILRMWPVKGWSQIEDASESTELPGFGLVRPREDSDAWVFRAPAHTLVSTAERTEAGAWVLVLFDAADFDYAEISLERTAGGDLRAPEVLSVVESLTGSTAGAVAWALEYRWRGITLARSDGRTAGR